MSKFKCLQHNHRRLYQFLRLLLWINDKHEFENLLLPFFAVFSGYVQGMSDLLSPILVLMEDEVEAFWCFVGFMEKLASILL